MRSMITFLASLVLASIGHAAAGVFSRAYVPQDSLSFLVVGDVGLTGNRQVCQSRVAEHSWPLDTLLNVDTFAKCKYIQC